MRVAAATGAVLIAALVGCASSSGGAATPGTTTGGTETSLRIAFWPKGRSEPGVQRWTLRCGPAGGTLPRAAAACRKLDALERPFAPVPKDVACTEIYGGPGEAVVSGRFEGRRVWALFTRRDGCQIERWNRHAFLWGGRTGGAP